MKPSATQTRDACRAALWQSFGQSAPTVTLDKDGYVSDASENLIEGVRFADCEADLSQGAGNELTKKFRAAHSSSALAVNAFAPFKAEPAALWLPVSGGFRSLRFEERCPSGLDGTPPNLDVVVEGPGAVVAIESKCLEHLGSRKKGFSPAYDADIKDARRETAWFREMKRLVENPDTYCWLNATQLVKHAFALARTFGGRSVVLLYVYWEPSNAEAYPVFAEHRDEVLRFAEAVFGGGPDFMAISYPMLWTFWSGLDEPGWLQTHVDRLRARYKVAA